MIRKLVPLLLLLILFGKVYALSNITGNLTLTNLTGNLTLNNVTGNITILESNITTLTIINSGNDSIKLTLILNNSNINLLETNNSTVKINLYNSSINNIESKTSSINIDNQTLNINTLNLTNSYIIGEKINYVIIQLYNSTINVSELSSFGTPKIESHNSNIYASQIFANTIISEDTSIYTENLIVKNISLINSNIISEKINYVIIYSNNSIINSTQITPTKTSKIELYNTNVYSDDITSDNTTINNSTIKTNRLSTQKLIIDNSTISINDLSFTSSIISNSNTTLSTVSGSELTIINTIVNGNISINADIINIDKSIFIGTSSISDISKLNLTNSNITNIMIDTYNLINQTIKNNKINNLILNIYNYDGTITLSSNTISNLTVNTNKMSLVNNIITLCNLNVKSLSVSGGSINNCNINNPNVILVSNATINSIFINKLSTSFNVSNSQIENVILSNSTGTINGDLQLVNINNSNVSIGGFIYKLNAINSSIVGSDLTDVEYNLTASIITVGNISDSTIKLQSSNVECNNIINSHVFGSGSVHALNISDSNVDVNTLFADFVKNSSIHSESLNITAVIDTNVSSNNVSVMNKVIRSNISGNVLNVSLVVNSTINVNNISIDSSFGSIFVGGSMEITGYFNFSTVNVTNLTLDSVFMRISNVYGGSISAVNTTFFAGTLSVQYLSGSLMINNSNVIVKDIKDSHVNVYNCNVSVVGIYGSTVNGSSIISIHDSLVNSTLSGLNISGSFSVVNSTIENGLVNGSINVVDVIVLKNVSVDGVLSDGHIKILGGNVVGLMVNGFIDLINVTFNGNVSNSTMHVYSSNLTLDSVKLSELGYVVDSYLNISFADGVHMVNEINDSRVYVNLLTKSSFNSSAYSSNVTFVTVNGSVVVLNNIVDTLFHVNNLFYSRIVDYGTLSSFDYYNLLSSNVSVGDPVIDKTFENVSMSVVNFSGVINRIMHVYNVDKSKLNFVSSRGQNVNNTVFSIYNIGNSEITLYNLTNLRIVINKFKNISVSASNLVNVSLLLMNGDGVVVTVTDSVDSIIYYMNVTNYDFYVDKNTNINVTTKFVNLQIPDMYRVSFVTKLVVPNDTIAFRQLFNVGVFSAFAVWVNGSIFVISNDLVGDYSGGVINGKTYIFTVPYNLTYGVGKVRAYKFNEISYSQLLLLGVPHTFYVYGLTDSSFFVVDGYYVADQYGYVFDNVHAVKYLDVSTPKVVAYSGRYIVSMNIVYDTVFSSIKRIIRNGNTVIFPLTDYILKVSTITAITHGGLDYSLTIYDLVGRVVNKYIVGDSYDNDVKDSIIVRICDNGALMFSKPIISSSDSMLISVLSYVNGSVNFRNYNISLGVNITGVKVSRVVVNDTVDYQLMVLLDDKVGYVHLFFTKDGTFIGGKLYMPLLSRTVLSYVNVKDNYVYGVGYDKDGLFVFSGVKTSLSSLNIQISDVYGYLVS